MADNVCVQPFNLLELLEPWLFFLYQKTLPKDLAEFFIRFYIQGLKSTESVFSIPIIVEYTLFILTFIGMSTEVITLRLNQVGRQFS
ncbi:hypothetical protein NtB2_01103 [Lactococcus termiticola]|uniref:Uncharacterized protein n=1 Tax=Lactococcus termiticola TaxID=2169526 RepID=A0A2R5HFY7_9LACT|nr:hypothetical protein NtB2_01103 [Lactococcus termiticola]